ncbi:MAG TPA: plastocyanin/azurin family copper-binding protein [Candidatus Limnocylindria bacterium]|nr:plastocyanin/azurin family copper-binding protein [Candidatus Limnocylindria bacterium]
MSVRHYSVLLVSIVLISACGAAPSPTAPTAAATTASAATSAPAAATAAPTITASPTPPPAVVEMGDHFFDPAQLTVKVGATVTWKSVGQSTHDLAARDGSFSLGAMSFGQTFSFTFTKAGRYPYVCMQHEGDGMLGEVTVID